MRIRGERERQEEHERENILERRIRHKSSRGCARLDHDSPCYGSKIIIYEVCLGFFGSV